MLAPVSVFRRALILATAAFGFMPLGHADGSHPVILGHTEHFLLISATDDVARESSLGVALDSMQQSGITYDRFIASQDGAPRTDQQLVLENADGTARYSGILLTSNQVSFQNQQGQWQSGLTSEQWAMLSTFEMAHHIRQFSLYSYPGADMGMAPNAQLINTPTALSLSANAEQLVPGVTAAGQLQLAATARYPARLVDASHTQPILFYEAPLLDDGTKSVAAAIVKSDDGREQLHFYFMQDRAIAASMQLAPLGVKWLADGDATVLAVEPSNDPFVGAWTTKFQGFTDTRFEGTAHFSVDGSRYAGAWTIGAYQYEGPAVMVDNKLIASWSLQGTTSGIAVYDIAADGSLTGAFEQAGPVLDRGTETIDAVNLTAAQGVYALHGHSDRVGDYQGTVSITRQQNTYKIGFYTGGDNRGLAAIGIVSGNKFIVAHGYYTPFGLAEYSVLDDGSIHGRWVRYEYDTIFDQLLMKSAR